MEMRVQEMLRRVFQGVFPFPARHVVIFGDGISSPDPKEHKWPYYLRDKAGRMTTYVHNYASQGASVMEQLSEQLEKFLTSAAEGQVKRKPQETIFVFFIGHNDFQANTNWTSREVLCEVLGVIQELQEKVKARQFLVMDLLPIHKTPACIKKEDPRLSNQYIERIYEYNEDLAWEIANLRSHTKATLLQVNDIVEEVLENPQKHGFSQEDVSQPGRIWRSDLQPSSAMQELIAEAVVTQAIQDTFPQWLPKRRTSLLKKRSSRVKNA
jgi:phospholipase/lecithinase/hemolysin